MITWRGYIDFKSESMAIIFPKDLFPCVGCAACSSAMACIYAAVRDRPDDGWVSLLFAFHPVASYHFLRLSFIFFFCVLFGAFTCAAQHFDGFFIKTNSSPPGGTRTSFLSPNQMERGRNLFIKKNQQNLYSTDVGLFQRLEL